MARDDAGSGRASGVGPIDLERSRAAVLRPVPTASLGQGFWEERCRLNTEVGIPGAIASLGTAGNVHNLELAAGAEGEYRGDLPFLDSDVYKWLEAVAWDARHGSDGSVAPFAARLVELLGRAQQADGYLQSYFQVHRPGERFVDLPWGHELYCAGHLVQAAVAHARALGDDQLLDVASRFVGAIAVALGPDGRPGICGHPEIEMALVELYRLTGERRHLELASLLVDRRGHGLLAGGRFGSAYWQDDEPVRGGTTARGHAVRQLYLLCGVVDLYLETGDAELLDAAEAQWTDLVATKTYVTGGQGARHVDESLGDSFELPPDRAYCETCAAIGSVMLGWRLLLATGRARYGELVERTLYNGFLSGVSVDGDGYRYVNPLQVRHATSRIAGDQDPYFVRWFRCACCPPNVMRMLASLEHYVCARRDDGLALVQYVSGDFGYPGFTVRVVTGYPWAGEVHVSVLEAPEGETALALRVPSWAASPRVEVDGVECRTEHYDGWLVLRREWREGEQVDVSFDLAVRTTRADRRVDAVRGSVALERGPLVYCVEQQDNPGLDLDDVVAVHGAGAATHDPGLLGGVTVLEVDVELDASAPGAGRLAAGTWWPYGSPPGPTVREAGRLTAIPFYAWGNRARQAMRVWLPAGAAEPGRLEEG